MERKTLYRCFLSLHHSPMQHFTYSITDWKKRRKAYSHPFWSCILSSDSWKHVQWLLIVEPCYKLKGCLFVSCLPRTAQTHAFFPSQRPTDDLSCYLSFYLYVCPSVFINLPSTLSLLNHMLYITFLFFFFSVFILVMLSIYLSIGPSVYFQYFSIYLSTSIYIHSVIPSNLTFNLFPAHKTHTGRRPFFPFEKVMCVSVFTSFQQAVWGTEG